MRNSTSIVVNPNNAHPSQKEPFIASEKPQLKIFPEAGSGMGYCKAWAFPSIYGMITRYDMVKHCCCNVYIISLFCLNNLFSPQNRWCR